MVLAAIFVPEMGEKLDRSALTKLGDGMLEYSEVLFGAVVRDHGD